MPTKYAVADCTYMWYDFSLIVILWDTNQWYNGLRHCNGWVVSEWDHVCLCISYAFLPSVADSSGSDDVMYTDLKNNLYSPVSHITFTHQPRFVDRQLYAETVATLAKFITLLHLTTLDMYI